jgi:hypothetical protein
VEAARARAIDQPRQRGIGIAKRPYGEIDIERRLHGRFEATGFGESRQSRMMTG